MNSKKVNNKNMARNISIAYGPVELINVLKDSIDMTLCISFFIIINITNISKAPYIGADISLSILVAFFLRITENRYLSY